MKMTWASLLANNTVSALPPTKAELDKLRSIVSRSLKDAAAPGLSTDARFIMAYDAARTMALIIVRAAGYRPKMTGGHHNTFVALETAAPAFATQSAYFDGCRIKRNASEYDAAGGVSETEAGGLFETARQFAIEAEAWIKTHHPHLA